MKKTVALILALILIGAAAYAAIDLSGMSFDELMELRAQVDAALWASDGWTEATVPQGVYNVGEDIPAGRWTIKANASLWVFIYNGESEYCDSMYWLDSSDPQVNLVLKEGQRIEINGTVTFTPYTSAALGFK